MDRPCAIRRGHIGGSNLHPGDYFDLWYSETSVAGCFSHQQKPAGYGHMPWACLLWQARALPGARLDQLLHASTGFCSRRASVPLPTIKRFWFLFGPSPTFPTHSLGNFPRSSSISRGHLLIPFQTFCSHTCLESPFLSHQNAVQGDFSAVPVR